MSAAHLSDMDQAERARATLQQFKQLTGSDETSALADLLADLMHFCDRFGLNFERELHIAAKYHRFECEGSFTDGGVQ